MRIKTTNPVADLKKIESATSSDNYKKVIALLIFIFNLGCSTPDTSKPINRLSAEGFQELSGGKYPIKYRAIRSDTRAAIVIEYQFKKSNPGQHFVIEIFFSESGKMLAEADSIEQNMAGYTSVGHKSRYTFLGAGPGGSAEQLIFTDTRKKHDVKIISSHLLPNDVEPRMIAIEDIAIYINKALLNGYYVEESYD